MPKKWTEKAKVGFLLFLFTTLVTFVDFFVTLFRGNVLADMKVTTWLYFIPAALGQAAMIALPLYLVYLLLSAIFKRHKAVTITYVVLAILLQIVVVLDGLVFNLYRFHINGFVLDLVFGAGSEVFVFDFWLCVKFAGLILLVAVVPYLFAIWLCSRAWRELRSKTIVLFSILLVLCLVVAHLGHAYASAARKSDIRRSGTVMPLFFPLRANTLFAKLGMLQTDEIDNVNYNIASSDLNYPKHPLVVADSIPKYNVVHILIDSWNPSVFDSIVTPNIYRFSEQAEFYGSHFSSNDATSGSVFGMFFGIPNTYDSDFEIAYQSPLFVDQLVDNGYNIQVFPSATFLNPPFNKRIFRRAPDINVKTDGASSFERDNKLTTMALDFLGEQSKDKPFYSFLFYDLPHAISIPKEYRTKFQPSWDEADYLKLNNDIDREGFFNLYKNCMYHVDSLVGKVIDKLTAEGMLENTVILITGDHGQEFNENKKNFWGHGSNYSKWQLQIPLIFYYPGAEAGKKYTHMTTHYDITPTLMHRFFGVTNPSEDYSMGYDLTDNRSRYPHVVGNHLRFGFVFPDLIVSTDFVGAITITDRQLNDVPRSALKASDLQMAIDKKNTFYK